MSQPKESSPTPSIGQRLEEAREVADQFGCPVVINAQGENGTAVITIGKTPELSALIPGQKHVIFPPGEKAQVVHAEPVTTSSIVDGKKKKPQKPRSVHNREGLTGFWRGTYYENGVPRPRNGKNGNDNHKKR
ncbi:MAG: hypothetical protein HYY87_04080 [Candidatus Levybacteria bacterium]|nr:hypothetical protein [Candidatus Levybacteria bacterium]MBI3070451.1 hypothetical protein [Candidatus Levybacteria bacterium]MBI3093093.1 hypothetical protein [Candidatus Levybacteria bacterium]